MDYTFDKDTAISVTNAYNSEFAALQGKLCRLVAHGVQADFPFVFIKFERRIVTDNVFHIAMIFELPDINRKSAINITSDDFILVEAIH